VTKLHVLFDNGPTGVAILHECAEESREIDVAPADHGEHFVLDGFFEGPLILARFFENFIVAVLDVDEAELVFVLVGFGDGVAVAVNAVAGVEAEADVGVLRIGLLAQRRRFSRLVGRGGPRSQY